MNFHEFPAIPLVSSRLPIQNPGLAPGVAEAAVRYSAEVTIDRLRLLTKEHHCLEAAADCAAADCG